MPARSPADGSTQYNEGRLRICCCREACDRRTCQPLKGGFAAVAAAKRAIARHLTASNFSAILPFRANGRLTPELFPKKIVVFHNLQNYTITGTTMPPDNRPVHALRNSPIALRQAEPICASFGQLPIHSQSSTTSNFARRAIVGAHPNQPGLKRPGTPCLLPLASCLLPPASCLRLLPPASRLLLASPAKTGTIGPSYHP